MTQQADPHTLESSQCISVTAKWGTPASAEGSSAAPLAQRQTGGGVLEGGIHWETSVFVKDRGCCDKAHYLRECQD